LGLHSGLIGVLVEMGFIGGPRGWGRLGRERENGLSSISKERKLGREIYTLCP
jgi:hypothetical protein